MYVFIFLYICIYICVHMYMYSYICIDRDGVAHRVVEREYDRVLPALPNSYMVKIWSIPSLHCPYTSRQSGCYPTRGSDGRCRAKRQHRKTF